LDSKRLIDHQHRADNVDAARYHGMAPSPSQTGQPLRLQRPGPSQFAHALMRSQRGSR
jgi:hypothetical protein